MPSSIQDDVRGALATSLSSIAASVYKYVPEAVIPPAVVIVPDSPYLDMEIINSSTFKCKVNLTISCVVAYNSNPASLDNLEKLIISAMQAIPAGWLVEQASQPRVQEIGASAMLVSEIRVSTYYTQT